MHVPFYLVIVLYHNNMYCYVQGTVPCIVCIHNSVLDAVKLSLESPNKNGEILVA